MKKVTAVLVAMVLVVSLVSLVFAADMMIKGTVKSVDAKAGALVLTADGKDETLKASAADLAKVKAGDAVEVSVDNGTVKEIKAAAAKKAKAPVGC